MFVAWTKFSNPQGTGTLDIAIKDKKVQKISKLLGDVLPMNQQFFEMIAGIQGLLKKTDRLFAVQPAFF